MGLSGQQREELLEALNDAFRDKASLEKMLAFELNKNLDVVPGGKSLQEIVFNLIKTAEAQGWIENLVSAACKSNPGNLQLKAITEELFPIQSPEPHKVPSSNILSQQSTQKQKILVLAALPQNLRLDKQIREIEEAIKRSVKRDSFEIKIRTAVRPKDIRRALAEEKPQIVHFCGHGKKCGNLVLEDDAGNHNPILPTGLAALFKLHTDYVKCVLLSACYSALPAEAISKHINYVIGMNQVIDDRAAIVFAQGFYDGLGYDNIINNLDVIQRAFEEGIVAIQLENLLQGAIPHLWKSGVAQENLPVLGSLNEVDIKSPSLDNNSSDHTSRSAKGNVDYIRPEIVQPPQTDDLSGDHDLHYTRVRDLPKAANWKGAEGAPTKTSTPYDYSISIQKSQRSLETKVITRIEKGGFLDLGKLTIFTNSSVFEVEIYKENLGKDVYLELVMVRQGTFLMGSSNEESDRIDWEGPQRSVNVGSFLISQCVINQVQWNRVSALPKIDMDLNPDPSYFKGDRNPVEKVSWYEAYEFCNRLSQLTRRVYRLPSEAEWEYACRAGTRTPFYFGEIITPDLANFAGKHQRITTEVNQFFPNAFGLYGMHGNVLEWCADHWHENYVGAPNDGSAWLSDNKNAKRVARGGSWDVDPSYCRSARRSRYLPDVRQRTVGFRVICEQ